MMTVHEVSDLAGISIRTLQYYDRIGLLPPAGITSSGYRLYDESSLEKLQQILLFRELEFPLKDIREIVGHPGFDRELALRQQIELLTIKKERVEKLIALARGILKKEETNMSFDAFDTRRMDEYAEQAKAAWGTTPAYREYEQKSKDRTRQEELDLAKLMMDIFRRFGEIRDRGAASEESQTLVKDLQRFISDHYYTCTKQILSGLGQAYAAGGEFTENIDRAGGSGTAAFVSEAIRIFCGE